MNISSLQLIEYFYSIIEYFYSIIILQLSFMNILSLHDEMVLIILEYCRITPILVCKRWHHIINNSERMAKLRMLNSYINGPCIDRDLQLVAEVHHKKWVKYISDMAQGTIDHYNLDTFMVVDKNIDNLAMKVCAGKTRGLGSPLIGLLAGHIWKTKFTIYDSAGTYSVHTYNKSERDQSTIRSIIRNIVVRKYHALLFDLLPILMKILEKLGY